jgi:outer membrane protein assembly factor BamB
MSIRIVSSIATPDFGGMTLRIGDLNGDGAPDLLITQSDYGTRSIQCLTAVTIAGERLWQVGVPSAANGRVYSDLPVQVYDWDNDGVNEVLYVRQARYVEPCEHVNGDCRIRERANRYEGNALMVVLDGRTGREKTTIPLPAPADDCILLANLTGGGYRRDFVVKDRYWNMWGISWEGRVLWHWQGATGHYPAVADIDGDGLDAVFVGYALIDHDGTVLFDHQDRYGIDRANPGMHSDANAMARLSDGQWRLLYGNHGVHCLAPDGREIWHHSMDEAQHVVAGRFVDETSQQVAVVNRGTPRNERGAADLYLFDVDTGREIWKRTQPPGAWGANCQEICWTGRNGLLGILVAGRGPGRPVVVYNGKGEIVAEMEVPQAYCGTYDSGGAGGINTGVHYCYRADVYGDSRDEVIVVGWKGVRVYANAHPLAIPSLYNTTIYRGM